MRVPPFEMERWQSTYEHRVRYNLSESGVHPYTLAELIELTGIDPGAMRLEYTQSNGEDELRARIATLYDAAAPENVLVTTGGAEANFLVLWALVDPGDRVVVLEPTYGQTPGLARGMGAELVPFRLEESLGWQPEPGAAGQTITSDTRLVIVTNPNNPTGAILSEAAMDEIVEAAEAAGAWLLADEVYAGAEVDGVYTPSFWGRYERTVITNSLSKAYGLPGLRLGWAMAPKEATAELWARKDYTTIATTAVSQGFATEVLRDDVRPRVWERTRAIIRGNLVAVRSWLDARSEQFGYVPPEAGAICYVRYASGIGSSELAERLRVEQDVLVVPGDHFGMDGYVRIGFGNPAADLEAGLGRVERVTASLAPAVRAG